MLPRIQPDRGAFQPVLGVVLLMVTVFALGGMAAAYLYLHQGTPALDAKNCTVGVEPAGLTAIYMDSRGALDAPTRIEVENGLRRVVASLAEGDALHIYHSRPKGKSTLDVDFEGCKPKVRGNAWTADPRAISARFADFTTKVESSIQRALQRPQQDEAPILEAIVDIGTHSFRSSRPRNRLFIVSDLIQASGNLAHVKTIPTSEQFRALPSAASISPKLPRVSVCLVYLSRPSAKLIQGLKHIEFWQHVVERSGGSLGSCEPFSEPDVVVLRL